MRPAAAPSTIERHGDAVARQLPHGQPRALQQRPRLARRAPRRRRARASSRITPSAEPAPPVASAPVLQWVRIRRAPASRSAPSTGDRRRRRVLLGFDRARPRRGPPRRRRPAPPPRRGRPPRRGSPRSAAPRAARACRLRGASRPSSPRPPSPARSRSDADQRRAADGQPADRLGGVGRAGRARSRPRGAEAASGRGSTGAPESQRSAAFWRADEFIELTTLHRLPWGALKPALALALAATLGVPASAAAQGDPIMPLSQVQRGMHCTALSVVHGTDISSFDVERPGRRRRRHGRRRAHPDPRQRPGDRRDRDRPGLLRLADLLPGRRRRRSASSARSPRASASTATRWRSRRRSSRCSPSR